MKLISVLFIFVYISMLNSCQRNKPEMKDEENVFIERTENRKYNLTASFYGDVFYIRDENDGDQDSAVKVNRYIVFRNNQTGEEVRYEPTGDFPAGDYYSTNIWSPDEEYIVLPIGLRDGFAVFEAKNALNVVKENKYFDTIKIAIRNSSGGFYFHEFEKWEDNSVFSFRAGMDGDMFAFKYNVSKDELYCYREKCGEFDFGYNKKGKIKAVKKGDIATKTEH